VSDRRWNDWQNFAIIASDEELCEGGGGAEWTGNEDEVRGWV
jgi:hypothetical protein